MLFRCTRTFAVPHHVSLHSFLRQTVEQPSVHVAASLFQKLCYANKDTLSAGIIVAGWDKENGPSVYNIPLGGGLFRQPWAIGGWYPLFLLFIRLTNQGSGSTYVYGYCDATYQDGWGKDETVNFVRNSKRQLESRIALHSIQPSLLPCLETVPLVV